MAFGHKVKRALARKKAAAEAEGSNMQIFDSEWEARKDRKLAATREQRARDTETRRRQAKRDQAEEIVDRTRRTPMLEREPADLGEAAGELERIATMLERALPNVASRLRVIAIVTRRGGDA